MEYGKKSPFRLGRVPQKVMSRTLLWSRDREAGDRRIYCLYRHNGHNRYNGAVAACAAELAVRGKNLVGPIC